MPSLLFVSLAFGLAVAAAPARADVWDIQSDDDNTAGTDNTLIPGTDQLHDLGAQPGPTADQDWYIALQQSFSSYEAVIDGTSGDLGFAGLAFERVLSDGTVIQTATAIGGLYSRSLSWANGTAPTATEFIRVSGGFCGTDCGTDDVYRIRYLETTLSVARFNNSGTQITSLLLQNTGDTPITGAIHFFSAAGANITSQAFTLAAHALFNFNTSSVAPGVGGSMLIAHDGRYGQLSGKAVALEPSTGFTFDTLAVAKPNQ